MIEALLAVVVFTGIVLALVLLILLARSRLLPSGTAIVAVNGQRQVAGALGERLLDVLASAGIALPAACGGKGTCGQCRVDVTGAVPPPLPTDAERLSSRALAAGARLACQLRLRHDLAVSVPEEIFGVKQWRCRVRSARCVGSLIREIVAELPEGEKLEFRAGTFVQVTAPPYQKGFRDFRIEPERHAEWDRLDLWRHNAGTKTPTTRAYSLANHPGEDRIVMLIVRLATPPSGAPLATPPGIVSSYLFGIEPGDALDVAGPYGHFFVEESEREMIFVGGGAGMAPMRSHIFDQLLVRHTQRRIRFFYGARNRRELFYVEDFDRLQAEHENFRWAVALSEPQPDDDWTGERGFVHEVVERRLAEHASPQQCDYYLCGPPLMVGAVLAMLDRLGVSRDRVRFDDFGT